ncbi:unnamed protein product [Clonostachys solani]|uniref:GH64 domain-containing protein n=1 Tax=Clonostachys solani TaxID=160281 RepID=A0A9N9ZML1_9HYPO|nr:unnamed protein product [Clonostachys solani]
MRAVQVTLGLLGLATATSAALIPLSLNEIRSDEENFTEIKPGDFASLVITKENTLNGTYQGDELTVPPSNDNDQSQIRLSAVAAQLPLEFVNNFGGAVNAYVTGLDSNNAVVFVRRDGSLFYPSAGGSSTPVQIDQNKIKIPVKAGERINMKVLKALRSGRVYFSAGALKFGVVRTPTGAGLVQPDEKNPTDPSAGVNWGFVELTLNADGSVWVNLSYVDFVGLPLGIELGKQGGGKLSAYGVGPSVVKNACVKLKEQAQKDGRPWGGLCQAGSNGPIRILSPNSFRVNKPTAFGNYYQDYVNKVWTKYGQESLTVATQMSAGRVKCRVSSNVMKCDGSNRSFAKPTINDIWSCDNGPFKLNAGDNKVAEAIIPRLCAAFHRSTFLLSGGNVQPNLGLDKYYTVSPTNHYSRIVHAHQSDGKGYTFPYDDVLPTGGKDASGLLTTPKPSKLTILIGKK